MFPVLLYNEVMIYDLKKVSLYCNLLPNISIFV